MAEEDRKEQQGDSLVTTIGKACSYIVHGSGTGDDNAGTEEFELVPMKSIPSEALGYFENRKDNTYIKVTSDAIILNEFSEIDNADLSENSKGNQTVIESIAGEYYNILPKLIKHTQVFGNGCGFSYDSKNDAWSYDEEMDKEETKKEENDERKADYPWTRINFDLDSNASYVIVIGDTGVGKSSLLKLLTNYNGIKTSDGVKSCTTLTSFYALLSKNICFVDTRGTEDSDTYVTDEQTLNEIQRKMHQFHGSLCKIIWIVHPAARDNKHLEQQVSFISKLGETVNEGDENKDNYNKMNIWDSVMITVCRPSAYSQLTKEIQGVILKTQEKGCSKDHWKVGKNLFGYTNLNWMDQTTKGVIKMMKVLKNELQNDSDDDSVTGSDQDKVHHGNTLHYYYNEDIKSFIYNSLLNDEIIKPFELLRLNYQCIKCGIIGNPKFVGDLKCHSKAERYHPSHVSQDSINNPGQMIDCMTYTHSNNGQNERKHYGKEVSFHSKALRVADHPGKIQRRHTMEPIFSTGGKWAVGITAVAGGLAGGFVAASALAAGTAVAATATVAAEAAVGSEAVAAVIGVGIAGEAGGAGAVYAARNAIGKGFTYLGYENCGMYPCCGGNMVSKGCLREYDCCGRPRGNEGCRALNESNRKYKCCGNDINHQGCKEKYDCCGEAPNSVGCRMVCGDCKEALESQACSYEMKCCGIKGLLKDKNDEKDGCLMKCNECQKPWGLPISVNDEYWQDNGGSPSEPQGCCAWCQHQMVKID